MPLPAVAPFVQFTINLDDFERRLEGILQGGAIVANIYNDAHTPEGVYYWSLINNGRGPVRPINAKALHWIDPTTGKSVFAKYARGVPPLHIRENAIHALGSIIIPGDFSEFSRETLHRFVIATAEQLKAEMELRTPVRTGALKSGYRIE